MKWPIVSNKQAVQCHYECMRLSGESHLLAEMLALQEPPGVAGTDAIFLQGHVNGNQFERQPEVGTHLRRMAEARGVDTSGKVYLSGLAAYQGDPEAWVSGRGDLLRVVSRRGWNCSGAVNHRSPTGVSDGPGPDIPLADDIVEDKALGMMEQNSDMTLGEAKAEAMRKHAPKP